MKKSQMEAVGILVFVIIIIFGIVIYIGLTRQSDTEPATRIFSYPEIATNTLKTLMKTSVNCNQNICACSVNDCGSVAISDIVMACAKNEKPFVATGPSDCSNVNTIMKEFLDGTFNNRGIKYKFEIGGTDRFPIINNLDVLPGECENWLLKNIDIGRKDDNTIITARLRLCR
jgi:disulfide bond formation protein DsbB